MNILTSLQNIKTIAAAKENENDSFRVFVKNQDTRLVDKNVQELNDLIAPQIDCTQCGNCCKSLMINVTQKELTELSNFLNQEEKLVKEKYIEESQEGQLIINTIPCHFLSEKKCSIYENRFTECWEFPHLHKENFSSRLFGMLFHYASCPIIFNVVEELKTRLGFKP